MWVRKVWVQKNMSNSRTESWANLTFSHLCTSSPTRNYHRHSCTRLIANRGMLSQRTYSTTTSNTPMRPHQNTSLELSSTTTPERCWNTGISSNQKNIGAYGYIVLQTNWGDCSVYVTYLAQTRVSSLRNLKSRNTNAPPTVASAATFAYKRKRDLSHSTNGRR